MQGFSKKPLSLGTRLMGSGTLDKQASFLQLYNSKYILPSQERNSAIFTIKSLNTKFSIHSCLFGLWITDIYHKFKCHKPFAWDLEYLAKLCSTKKVVIYSTFWTCYLNLQ